MEGPSTLFILKSIPSSVPRQETARRCAGGKCVFYFPVYRQDTDKRSHIHHLIFVFVLIYNVFGKDVGGM